MANFIKLVYATLKSEGIDTKDMDTDEAVEKFKELQEKSGGKVGENKGTPAEQKRLRELGVESKEEYNLKQNAVLKLVDTLKKVKKVKIKELHNYIKSLNPVKLQINNDEIIAQFDKFTADKNIYGIGNSDIEGYRYKLNNVDNLHDIIESSSYLKSKNETGKNSKQHKGVKEWHYFVNNINTDKGEFNVVVNIRDKGENKFIYEVSLKQKKT